MLRIAFDIGGVLSKYPDKFRELCNKLHTCSGIEMYVITDMHNKEEVLKTLSANKFDMIPPERVFSSDYDNYGEMCKAILLKELNIDIFIDDFAGYCNWDSQLGESPIRLLIQPDPFKPYWNEDWQVSGDHHFGRRVSPKNIKRE